MNRKEEIASLTIVGVLIFVCYLTVIYVIHTQVKKQPIEKKVVHSTKICTDWNLTELQPRKRIYFENL